MKHNDILFILISSFVLVVAWIGFNLHHKWFTSTISEDLQISLTAIDPNFDQETIEKLKTRKKVSPLYQLKSAEPTTEPTPKPSIAPPALTPEPESAINPEEEI